LQVYYLTVIVISLVLSFYFSGTETAFVSVNKVRVELWRRQRIRAAQLIYNFLKKPERFLYTTLVGNNIFNVAFASFATIYFNQYLNPRLTWLGILLLTIFLGEIIPKTLFRSLADWVVRGAVYPLEFFYRLFYPFILIVSHISEMFLRLFGVQRGELQRFFSKKDIEILLYESQDMVRQIPRRESEFLRRILEMRELRVRDAMIPRTEIVAVSENMSLKEVGEIFTKHGFTRLPVYSGTLDNVVGVVFLKDLFQQPRSLKDIIRPIMMVPDSKRVIELLSEFRENNTSIAIVVDEYGGTAGLVTTEDLVEELFGEIQDEYDMAPTLVRKLDDHTYSVNARIEIEQLNRELGIHLPEGNYETLAGFLLYHLGHIPRREEEFEFQQIKFIITRATRRKIEWVKIVLPRS